MIATPGLRRLFATCGALTVALLPHLGHLPMWIVASFALTVAWRLVAEHRGFALPSQGLRVIAALAAVLAVLLGYRTLNGLDAGTALLTLMAGLKLSETRAPRDHAVLIFVGYLLCLATLLYQESLPRLGFVLLAVWLLTAALARSHRPVGANSPLRPLLLATRLLGFGLPLAAILFLFVPRLEGRFWALPTHAAEASTGIGDEMTPGDVASLALSDEPAFRAWFHDARPAPEQRYWRVQVLEQFDGRTWRRLATGADAAPPPTENDERLLGYKVALEPTNRPWLVGLETVVDWPRTLAVRSRSGQLSYHAVARRDAGNVVSRFEYELRSAPAARVMAGALPDDLQRRDLQLPPGRAPRSQKLALELRAAAGTDRAYIAAVLARFHEQGYEYTLEPPLLGAEATDEFLFDTRQGFCEHFAAAFAVLMRAAGIPARVVLGYQGGDWNGYGDYLLVRQSSAHAWDEVWLQGSGWVRVDPTAAVAPERVRQGGSGLLRAGGGLQRVLPDWPWLGRARQLWDATRTAWYEGMVNFDPLAQQRLLERLGLGAFGTQGLAIALTIGFVLVALGLSAWLAWEFRPRPLDPLTRAWRTACASLAAAGLPRAGAEGPLDYARRVAGAAPALAPAVTEFVDAYVRARYLPHAGPADLERVQALLGAVQARARALSA